MLSKFGNKLKSWLKNRSLGEIGPVATLFIIALILCIRNYSLGTWLSGWDTLHPEFNFQLAFERAFFGVFRVEQGLGAVAGHSHMADLPRILILYLSHFVLPLSFLRYFYIFLNLIVGTLGMYFLLNKYFLKQNLASFLGALFYLLNVGTVQIFNVPFEMFTTLFATIPLIFYFAKSYLKETSNRHRNLFFFGLFGLLNSPSAYAATLWYVFFAGFLIYFFLFSLVNLNKDKKIFKRFFTLIIVFLAVNFYWLTPNIYFILNHGAEVAHANINILFSDQAFLKNKEFGTLNNLLLLKSFYFDWNIYRGFDSFTNLLTPYLIHFNSPMVLATAYVFAASFIGGAIYLIKRLKRDALPIFALLIFSLFFLVNSNFPLTPLFNFFQNHIPFFKEAFRFPDDKILNTYVFLVSIFFGFGALYVIEKLKIINKEFGLFFTILASILILFYSAPSFSGNFINSYMRVNIPKNYFALFDYLKTQPESAKVANLPIQSPWGWTYYNWYNDTKPSYQGAGFLYFGIKQPLMDRDFDRWSPFNESYYREMSYAIYSKDEKTLKNVLTKYKIGFVLIDKSVISPQNPPSVLFFEDSKKILKKTGLVNKELGFGTIELFKLDVSTDDVSSVNATMNVLPSTTTTYSDIAYQVFGDYLSEISGISIVNGFGKTFFAFRDLINNESKLHKDILTIDDSKITLNPLNKVENFNQKQISTDFNIVPADLIAEKNNNKIDISWYPNTPVFDNTPQSYPINASITLGTSENLILSMNQSELFYLGSLSQNSPISVGKVLLKNTENKVSMFDANGFTKVERVSKIINPFFSSCNGDNAPPNAGFDDNGMQIKGKGDICILIPYGYFPSDGTDDLLTNFGFVYTGSARITSCLFSQETSKCIYYRNPQRSGNIVVFSYVMPENQTGKTAIKIILESTNQSVNTYTLANLASSYSKSIANLNVPKSVVDKAFVSQNLVSFKKVYLPKNIVYDPGFKITTATNLESDCKEQGVNVKKEIVKVNGVETIRYNSVEGTFCDHFSYQNLPHSEAYLLVVKSKNTKGLPLTLCVTNYTSRRCDVYSNLSVYNKFDQDVFLLPPSDKDGLGYDINISSLGIVGSPSVNYISSIEFIPIPYQILQSINTLKNIPTADVRGKITNVIKYNPLFYVVNTNSNPTIVDLNLSYEKGFRAYAISCSGTITCFIKGALSPFYASEVNTHVLVNNWSNGWITGEKQIAIVFLPQYFEYFGLILIVITLLVLGKGLKIRK